MFLRFVSPAFPARREAVVLASLNYASSAGHDTMLNCSVKLLTLSKLVFQLKWPVAVLIERRLASTLCIVFVALCGSLRH